MVKKQKKLPKLLQYALYIQSGEDMDEGAKLNPEGYMVT